MPSPVKRRVPICAIRSDDFAELPHHETIWAIAAGCATHASTAPLGGKSLGLIDVNDASRRW